MKFSKLLVLSALWLTAGSAMAEIVDGVRQKPVPATTGFVISETIDTYYYLYNVAAKMFFAEGNNYNTRGSVANTTGNKVAFTEYADDPTVLIWNDYSPEKKAWKVVFFNDEEQIYVDRGSQANYGWVVEDNGATFRIHASDNAAISPTYNWASYPNMYVGVNFSIAPETALTPILAVEEGNCIDWAYVTEEDYVAYEALLTVYEKAQDLKAVIDEANGKGVDSSAATAVYTNEGSTIEEIEAAISALRELIANAATPTSPADFTSYIVNPNGDNNSNSGWNGTAPAMEYTVFEVYNANFNTYQDIEGLPSGVYAVRNHGFYRAGGTVDAYAVKDDATKRHAFIYAKSGEDSLAVPIHHIFDGANAEKIGTGTEYGPDGTDTEGQECYVPNNRQAAEQYFKRENDSYLNTVFMGVNDGNLRIGLAKNTHIGTDWTPWDTWTLSFLGNTAESYQYWIAEAKKSQPDYASALVGVIYTESYLTAYNDVVSNATASDYNSAVAAMKAMSDAAAALEKNVELYKELQSLKELAIEAGNGNYDASLKSELADWVEFDLDEMLKKHDLTNEALEAAIAEGKKLINDVVTHPIGEVDVTNSYLKNADFSTNDWTGWTKEAANGGNVAVSNSCAEAWNNSSFDIYQVYEGAPVGVYEISVQGFYRYQRGDNAWNAYQDQSNEYVQSSPVFVYLNAKQTPFKNVFAEDGQAEEFYSEVGGNNHNCYINGDLYYPDGMASAAVAFRAGMYTQKAYGLVKEGDPLRIGVKGSSNQAGDSWVIFDNFKLTFKGFDAGVISEVLAEELEKVNELLTADMGKTAYANLTKAIADAMAAIQANDGQAMFNALNALFEVESEVSASVKKFAELAAALETLAQEIESSQNATAKTDANKLMEDIQTSLSNHDIDESELDGIYEQIASITTQLRMPDYASASDANAVDFTNIITNADYSENAAGWTTEANVGYSADGANAEFFNQDYDYYQEFSGLPAGTYRVAVKGFYRAGEAKEDYADFNGDNANNNAYLYAVGESQVSKSLTRLSEYTMEVQETAGFTDQGNPAAWVVAEDQDLGDDMHNYILVCNNMTNAADLFMAGQYGGDPVLGTGNVVTVKVGADGKLRIGLKKSIKLANDWTIFDEWQLWYFGANSQLIVSDDPYSQGIEEVINLNDNVVRTDYFTIDGRKATAIQKGIIIQKMTLANGAVVVKKIRK